MKTINALLILGSALVLSACETVPFADDAFEPDARMQILSTPHGLINLAPANQGLSTNPHFYLDGDANPRLDKMLAGFDRTP